MMSMVAAGLLMATSVVGTEHVERIDHPAGAVEARYRGAVSVSYRQVGSVAPPGAPSSLRCLWSADLRVSREAQTPRATAARDLNRGRVLAGSRPGWCQTSRKAIAAEIAGREGEMLDHLRALAREDRADLVAELDRLHSARGAG